MPNTMILINSVTVGSGGASTIDFTSIPQTYTDLVLKVSARQGAENAFTLKFNGSTSSYLTKRLQADGSGASSNTASGLTTAIRVIGINPSGATANIFGNSEIYIPNYTGSTYKSVSHDGANEDNSATIYMNLSVGLWANTAAITSITLAPEAGSFVQYSTAYLYGIKNS